ncbi:MAG: serine/threonine protein phosphatase [Hyphomicrobiales bacterium]|nr:serine/threonine protein phosphatase [Hyphomicrobiales bacterium]MDE2285760.1 serine/threonine protein phosphatase [Hyphomicrobiales bacterium]MDE2374063.1 serine/threonine protein phosphatase [Hyphomicrobiales bacterium]
MPAKSFTYVIGDIHGSLGLLRTLIKRCRRHARGRGTTLVFLGDYIDRGPDSAGVVGFIMDLQSELRGRLIALKGNHEAMLIGVVDGEVEAESWLSQGGTQTLQSYGVTSADALPRTHLQWLRSLPTSHDDGRRFFAHAGIDPDRPLSAQRERDLIWIREPFLSDPRDHGRLIVHGHTPLKAGAPDLRGNRVNVDTGAVFGGALTAAVFDDAETNPVAFLQSD